MSISSETWPFNFNFVRLVTSRPVPSRIFQRVHPAISLRSSSNEKVTPKVTALQREIAARASPLFPVSARRGVAERKERKKQRKPKQKNYAALFFLLPRVSSTEDRRVVDNLSRPFGTRTRPVFIRVRRSKVR